MDQVAFTKMEDGTKEEYEFLTPLYEEHGRAHVVDNLVGLLGALAGPKLGYQIDRYEHSLQSASRAIRNDEPVDIVVAALLHDVADTFAPENHSGAAAAIIEPYVSEEAHWVVKHHGLFQGYYYFHHHGGDPNARDVYADSPHYDACVRFCAEYDQNCFDPDYKALPISDFVPLLQEVFNRPSRVPMVAM